MHTPTIHRHCDQIPLMTGITAKLVAYCIDGRVYFVVMIEIFSYFSLYII